MSPDTEADGVTAGETLGRASPVLVSHGHLWTPSPVLLNDAPDARAAKSVTLVFWSTTTPRRRVTASDLHETPKLAN